MNNTLSTSGLVALLVLATAGCASVSADPAGSSGRNTTATTTSSPADNRVLNTTTSDSDARGDRTDASSPERWNYDSMPSPAPSRSPGIRLDEIAFADNGAALDREGIAVCRLTAEQLANSSTRILLVGFSHKREADPELGLRRAEAVRRGLVEFGVDSGRIEIASFGSRFSQIPNSPHPYMVTAAQGVEIWTID